MERRRPRCAPRRSRPLLAWRSRRRRRRRRPVPAARRCAATLVDPDRDGRSSAGRASRSRTAAGAARPARCWRRSCSSPTSHVRDEESPGARAVPRPPRRRRSARRSGRRRRSARRSSPRPCGRRTRLRPDAAFVTGDLLDSASRAELDHGARGARRRRRRPRHRRARATRASRRPASPTRSSTARTSTRRAIPGCSPRAARPFRSPGLRAPWYPALGNHDLLVQGETPPTAQLDAFATGDRMVTGPRPGRPRRPGHRRGRRGPRAARRGRARPLAHRRRADPDRRFLRDGELIADAHGPPRRAARAPARRRPRDARLRRRPRRGRPRARARHRRPRRRLARPAAPGQLAWLRAELARAGDRAVLVFSHNPLDNTEGGEEALAALAATPAAVVAVIAGNGHRNRIRPHPAGFWQIATSSLADFPHAGPRAPAAARPGRARLRARDLDGRPRRRRPRRAPRASSPSSTRRAAGRRASRAAREDRNARLYVAR